MTRPHDPNTTAPRAAPIAILVLLVFGVGFGMGFGPGCGSTAGLGNQANPLAGSEDPCHLNNGESDPLVFTWPALKRGTLEGRLSKGVVAVRHVGCEIELLDCRVDGSRYDFEPVTAKRETIAIETTAELFAQLPDSAASLSAEFQRSQGLTADMMLVGQWREPLREDSGGDLLTGRGCRRATHIVSEVQVGGHVFSRGARSRSGASIGGYGARLGGGVEHSEVRLSSDGDPDACKAGGTGPRPPVECGGLLRLHLRPKTTSDDCVGLDLRKCQAACAGGDSHACAEVGEMFAMGRSTHDDAPAALQSFVRACELGRGDACARGALMLRAQASVDEYQQLARDEALLDRLESATRDRLSTVDQRASRAAVHQFWRDVSARGAAVVGQVCALDWDDTGVMREHGPEQRRACDLAMRVHPGPVGRWALGDTGRGACVDGVLPRCADSIAAAVLRLERYCREGTPLACMNLALWLDQICTKGNLVAGRPTLEARCTEGGQAIAARALTDLERDCAAGGIQSCLASSVAHRDGAGTAGSDAHARSFQRAACEAASTKRARDAYCSLD